jgi:hypothetical protein
VGDSRKTTDLAGGATGPRLRSAPLTDRRRKKLESKRER